MKRFILASFLVVAITASLEDDSSKFQSFKLKHGKIYKNQIEETKRFSIFKDNLRTIEEHNDRYRQGLESYKLGINKFTDMTTAEFRSILALQKSSRPKYNASKTFSLPQGVEVPDSIDWRQRNAVTGVKDQAACGSCWAFSITGSTEGAYALKTGNLVSLSEQQLVDCTTSINYGCGGGFLEDTFPYIEQYGLESESDYPYLGVDGTCQYDSSKVVTRINSYVTIYEDENQLKQAVGTVGPVSVTINANDFNSYAGGIFDVSNCSPYELNHGVLIVGYGSENGKDYWIVKNSWGSDWGEDGYIRVLRGVNQCGISEDNAYPVIN